MDNMDKRFYLESWRFASKSSEHIRWVLTGAVTVYFLHKDHDLVNSLCFWLDVALTCLGLTMVIALVIQQHKMLELDEKYWAKGVKLEQNETVWQGIDQEMSAIKEKTGKKLELDEEYWAKGMEREQNQKVRQRIVRAMNAIKEKNEKNLKCLKKLLYGVYIIAGISVIMSPICVRCFLS